jgi:autotransporter translocation and assembly factor TamB
MRRMGRSARWLLLGFLIIGGPSLLPAFSIPGVSFINNFIRSHLVEYVNATYHGTIAVGQFHFSLWGPIRLDDVTLSYQGRQIASISEVRIGYELLPLLQKRIVLSSLDVIRPLMNLAREPGGEWNLLAALQPRNPATPKSKSSFSLNLKRIALKQGDVRVRTEPTAAYHLADIYAAGSARMDQPQQQFKISSVAFALDGPKVPAGAHVQGAVEYDQAQVATVKLSGLQIWTNHSDILIDGAIRDLAAKHVNATVNLKKLAAADVNTVVPAANLARNLDGFVRVTGQATAMQADVALNSGPAHVNASANADIAKARPPWDLQAKLANVDLHQLLKPALTAQLPAGRINAKVKANATGFVLASINGKVDAQIAGLSMRAMRFGDLSVSADISKQVANLNANLKGANGAGRLAGKVVLSRSPAYQLTLALDHLHPARLTGSASIPAADLNLTADINGAGYQPATMRAQARVNWLRSSIQRVTIDSGRIEASVAGGVARIATVSFTAGQTRLNANGSLGLTADHAGTLNYQLAVGQLSQWLQMAGQHGSGQLQMAGQVNGTLAQLRTSGSAQLSRLKVDKYSVAQGSMTYDLGGLGKSMKPRGRITLAMAGLQAGVDLKTLRSQVNLTSGAVENAEVSAEAIDRFSHPASLRTNIAFRPQEIVADLTHLSIATDHGTWLLEQPARFTKHGDRLEIRQFAARNRDQTLALQGVVATSGPQDLTGNIQSLRISDFASYFPKGTNIAGLLNAQLTVRGTASSPAISVASNINRMDVDRVAYASISARLDYAQGRAQAQATVSQDPAHRLEASAALPIALNWSHGFQSRITGDLDARAASSGINLAFLNSLAGQKVSEIGGTVALDISARGPITHPAPSGYIRVIDARLSAHQVNVTVTNFDAMVELSPQQVRVVSLSAKAGEGTLTGGGTVTLGPDSRPQMLDLYAAVDKWPAIKTHRYSATTDARVTVTGSMQAPIVNGQAEILYGVFRPDLSVTGTKPHLDRTIAVVHEWRPVPAQTPPPPPPQPPAVGPLPNNLAVNFRVIIDRNTWIKTADFAVELQGDVHLVKRRNKRLLISGAIDTVRGTVVVAQRQFDVKRGQILFTGGHEINPELDLVAQMRVTNYLVSVNISGTAEKPKLTLSSIPDLPQSDILSVMMFGKPANQLTGSQQQGLQNQAISMAGGYAAAQIGQAVSQALGLGELGVSTTSGGLGIGRYLTQNLYVSASQSSANMQDRRAEVQYYLTPEVTLDSSASTNYGNEIKLQWHKEY